MTDYNKPTGTAGTLRIRDTGSTVEFWILCSDPYTNVGSMPWSGTVNGTAVGGSVALPAGFGSRKVGAWSVTYSQTVTFAIPASGTSGLGGPTSHSVALSRASVPGAPGVPVVSELTPTSARFTWAAAAANGSTVSNYGLYISADNFVTHAFAQWLGKVLTYPVLTLKPGVAYKARTRASNGVGTGPYSAAVSFTTPAGAYVSDGTAWKSAEVLVSDGTAWKAGGLQISDGTAWKPAG